MSASSGVWSAIHPPRRGSAGASGALRGKDNISVNEHNREALH
jgi:hypothetical protein